MNIKADISTIEHVLNEKKIKIPDFQRSMGIQSQHWNNWKIRGIPAKRLIEMATKLDVSVERLNNYDYKIASKSLGDNLQKSNIDYELKEKLRYIPHLSWAGLSIFLNSISKHKEFEIMPTNKVKVSERAFMIEFNSDIYADYINTGETAVIDPDAKPVHGSGLLVKIKDQYHVMRYESIDKEYLYPIKGTNPITISDDLDYTLIGPVVCIMSVRNG